eukprot:gene18717-25240_t
MDCCRSTLRSMGTNPEMHAVSEDGLFMIPISLKWRGKSVAVEACGEKHYAVGSVDVPLASVLARWRSLEMRRWRVLSVPNFHWKKLKTDEQRRCYLEAALDAVLWRIDEKAKFDSAGGKKAKQNSALSEVAGHVGGIPKGWPTALLASL